MSGDNWFDVMGHIMLLQTGHKSQVQVSHFTCTPAGINTTNKNLKYFP